MFPNRQYGITVHMKIIKDGGVRTENSIQRRIQMSVAHGPLIETFAKAPEPLHTGRITIRLIRR
jgi:hypothetical protein